MIEMINHTKAYKVLKDSQQSALNLLVLVGQAVPELERNLKAINLGVSFCDKNKKERLIKLTKHDIFEDRVIDIKLLQEKTSTYKEDLAKLIFISSFSFFEVYFKDVSGELLKFHGGKEVFLKHTEKKLFFQEITESNLIDKKGLQEPYEPHKKEKYLKNIKEIEAQGYVFPYEKFSLFGFHKFAEIFTKKDNTEKDNADFSAKHIPDLLKHIYGFNVDEEINKSTLRKQFNDIRNKRNRIIHQGQAIKLETALKHNDFLKNIAKQIDKHLIDNFFVIQQHVR